MLPISSGSVTVKIQASKQAPNPAPSPTPKPLHLFTITHTLSLWTALVMVWRWAGRPGVTVSPLQPPARELRHAQPMDITPSDVRRWLAVRRVSGGQRYWCVWRHSKLGRTPRVLALPTHKTLDFCNAKLLYFSDRFLYFFFFADTLIRSDPKWFLLRFWAGYASCSWLVNLWDQTRYLSTEKTPLLLHYPIYWKTTFDRIILKHGTT